MSHAIALLLVSTLLIASSFAHGSGFPVLHSFPVGSNPTIASAGGDLNGDGKNDLVVVHYCNLNNPTTTCTHGTLSVLLGKGNGSFESATTSALVSLPSHLILADLNGDGHLDVVVGGKYSGNDVIEVRLGNGNGTFGPPNVFPTVLDMGLGNPSQAFRAADFNGDGKLDLLGISGESELVTLPGKGDGTFGPPRFTSLPAPARVLDDYLAIGDFDNDGKLDVALTVFAGSFFNSLSVNLGNGDGTFRPLSLFKPGRGLNNLVAADFDGDGTLDLVIQGETVLRLFHGNGDGTFQISRQFNPAGVPGAFLVTADLDGNGKPDIVLGDSAKLTILLNPGSASPPRTLYYSLGVGGFAPGSSLVLEDLNGDSLLDAVTVDGAAIVAPGIGHGELGAPRRFRTSPFSTGIAVGDFNNDDKLDVATVNLYGAVFTIMGFGNGSLGGYRKAKAGSIDSFGTCCLTLADFNNDGKLDALVMGTFSASGIFLGNGDRTFQLPIDLPAGSASVVGDFNRDGKLDVVIALGDLPGIQLYFGNGDGTFRAGPVFGQNLNTARIAAADFNRDGKLDLVVGFSVLLGNGDGTFRTPMGFGSGEFGPIITYDINGDDLPDILTLDRSGLSVFLGNGDGTFQAALNTPFKTAFTPFQIPVHGLALGDFNRDGKPDVASIIDIGSPVACVLYGHGDGTFRSPVPLRAGGIAIDLAVGDMDRNGTPDLVVTDGSNLFTVLLNQP